MAVLVIVESPTKAKTITNLLKKDFIVKASKGHIRDLPKSKLGIDIENNFKPQYITIRGKGDVLKDLRKAVKKADQVILATDPDREGEAISWHLAQQLKLDEDAPLRVVFHEITKEAIDKAFSEPRTINKNLVDAQQARRVLDRIVGYNLSPLLWKKIGKGLSAGRVQSVAVKIIVDREKEREAFVPEEYWTIEVDLANDEQEKLKAQLFASKEKEKIHLPNQAIVTKIENALKNSTFTVQEIKNTTRQRHPAPPFITSSLQQEAAKRLRFSARKTMVIAQQLYEGIKLGSAGTIGLITYMRTDSVQISNEARSQAKRYIEQNFGSEYYQGRKYTNKKDSQAAHEAIRPTSIDFTPKSIKEYLSNDQYKIYNLIWTRFVASQMSSAKLAVGTIIISTGEYLFKLTGSQLKFPGFLAVDKQALERIRKNEQQLPTLQINQILNLQNINSKQHFTEPPARFTEASLIKYLEEKGIGRPSTYAPIIDTINKRGYVTKEEGRFVPTELASVVTDLLESYFNELISVAFTAQMENELDKVEAGSLEWENVIAAFYDSFAENLKIAEQEANRIQINKEEEVTDIICEKCGRNMVIKHGRFGKFLACPGFPECRNTKPILKEIGVPCPLCDGKIIERKSKRGKLFYGCSNYPECKFMVWDKPINRRCPLCNSILLEKPQKNSSNKHIICSNKECGYEEKG